ncbi:MAG: hypothetical protein SGPRY_012304 [Prymnesium sp.]
MSSRAPHGRSRRIEIPPPSSRLSNSRCLPADAEHSYERRLVVAPKSAHGSQAAYYQYCPSEGAHGWSDARPAPPQHPLVAAMARSLRSEGLLSSREKLDDESDGQTKQKEKTAESAPAVTTVSCWRLRLCALFILAGLAVQAVILGGQLQAYVTSQDITVVALGLTIVVLISMLLALWSLLSQLLLWSETAVFKVSQHMVLRAEYEHKPSTSSS